MDTVGSLVDKLIVAGLRRVALKERDDARKVEALERQVDAMSHEMDWLLAGILGRRIRPESYDALKTYGG